MQASLLLISIKWIFSNKPKSVSGLIFTILQQHSQCVHDIFWNILAILDSTRPKQIVWNCSSQIIRSEYIRTVLATLQSYIEKEVHWEIYIWFGSITIYMITVFTQTRHFWYFWLLDQLPLLPKMFPSQHQHATCGCWATIQVISI